VVDREMLGVDFRDEGEHTGRNDLLFVERTTSATCKIVIRQKSMSTQPCIPPGSLNGVPALAGVKAEMSPLSGGR